MKKNVSNNINALQRIKEDEKILMGSYLRLNDLEGPLQGKLDQDTNKEWPQMQNPEEKEYQIEKMAVQKWLTIRQVTRRPQQLAISR